MFGVGIGLMSQKVFTFIFLHLLPLIFTTSPGGVATGLLQNVFAAYVCYVPGRSTVAAGSYGSGMVAAFCGALQTPVFTSLQIMPC